MRIEDGQYVGSKNELKVFNLLCEGKSQIEVAGILNVSKPYVNQITKRLLTLELIKDIKKSNGSNTYLYIHNKDISELSLDVKIPKKKKILGDDNCLNCGKKVEIHRIFCNLKCKGAYQSGPRSSQWKGGSTFQPYCWKFNGSLKERVRAFFGYVCFTCGETGGPDALHVHHIQYNKMACCDGKEDALLIPLCTSCHNRTNRDAKNGFWEKLFYTQLIARTGGKCYYSKKEWRLMGGDPPALHLLKVNEDLLFLN